MFDSVFGRSFNSAKCKTLLRLAISRIKLLRNKRDIQLKQMKRELAQLLQTNQEPSAWIRVEHIFREQNIMAAYEIIELFCELIVVRLPIIDSQRQCPIDLREAVASLIFAAPRCSDVPELLQVRNLLSAKYGKEFVFAAAELRPDCGVNRLVEHIFREQNIMAAYEIIELFCELIVVRLPIIDSQRQCPIDLREAVASLIFAAPRCSDVPELLQVRNLLSAKYGKEFVFAAAELRPDCGVNRLVIEKLSVRAPPGDVKVKLMKDIAVEQNVDWDPTVAESEFLKAPEDLLEGPTHFLGASQMSLETPPEEPNTTEPVVQQNQKSESEDSSGTAFKFFEASSDEKQFIPFVLPVVKDQIPIERKQSTSQRVSSQMRRDTQTESSHTSPSTSLHRRKSLGSDHGEDAGHAVNSREESYKDVVSAARAAAESAERAAAAARSAALLASKTFDRGTSESSSDSDGEDNGNIASRLETGTPDNHHEFQFDSLNNHSASEKPTFDEPEEEEGSQSASRYPVWPPRATIGKYDDDQDLNSGTSFSKGWNFHNNEVFRSRSLESTGAPPHFDTDQTDIGDTETEDGARIFAGTEPPVIVKTPSHVHPKLPDYDDLTARFEAFKSKR